MSTLLSGSVGLRNGMIAVANAQRDLSTVCDLFDRIRPESGGTAGVPGGWPAERRAVIAELAGYIVAFQTLHGLPVKDGVIDPGGSTIRKMDSLADQPPAPAETRFAAERVETEGWTRGTLPFDIVDPNSVSGGGPLRYISTQVSLSRHLIRVANCPVKWFGVVFPSVVGPDLRPHIYFHPAPWQGGGLDATYDQFFGSPWATNLWETYPYWMGGQLAASYAKQVLVIPFYKNTHIADLGSFNRDWRAVVSAVVTTAMNAEDPFLLRDTYTFNGIFTSSFSNGWVIHKQFQDRAVGAADQTVFLFDLDGVAAGSMWRPEAGVIYLDRRVPPGHINPVAQQYYLGHRWGQVGRMKKRYDYVDTHWAVNQYMLYHGLWRYGN